jgi:hypothetical protein
MCGGALAPVSLVSTAIAEEISDARLGFRFTVPKGFQRAEQQDDPNIVYAFVEPPETGQTAGRIIGIERMGGQIGREGVDALRKTAPPGVTLTTERWKSFEIVVGRVEESLEGVPMVILNAQVPLKPEAVLVKAIGPLDREADVRAALREALAGLDGSTNWLTDRERENRFLEGLSRLGTTASVFLVLLLVIVWAFRRRSQTKTVP